MKKTIEILLLWMMTFAVGWVWATAVPLLGIFFENQAFYDDLLWEHVAFVGFWVLLISYLVALWIRGFVFDYPRKTLLVGGWALLFATGVLLHGGMAGVAALSRSNPEPIPTKMLILGLDAANASILDPWIEEGILPTIQKLREEGYSTELTSMEPMRSPLLWTTIATGRSPDAHGVSGFFATRREIQAPRIFDVAHQEGMSVGLFQWLVTWPVLDIFDFVIPAWMARSPETWPPAFVPLQEIMLEQERNGNPFSFRQPLWESLSAGARASTWNRLEYKFRELDYQRSEEHRMAHKMIEEVRLQTDLFLHAMESNPVDLATFTLYGSDKLGHRLWHHMDPEAFPESDIEHDAFLAGAIRQYYIEADRAFGRILERMPDDCRVVLLSDHGMKADPQMPGQFFVKTEELLRDLGFLDPLHITPMMRSVLVRGSGDAEIDWLRYKTVIEQEVFWVEDKEPLFQVDVQEDGITIRPNLSLTAHPESQLASDSLIVVNGEEQPVSRYFFPRYFSGTHDLAGILMLNGPGVDPQKADTAATLLDVAPTLLYWLGLPISEELEGEMLTPAFTQDYRDQNTPEFVPEYPPLEEFSDDSSGDNEALQERLRSVGYL